MDSRPNACPLNCFGLGKRDSKREMGVRVCDRERKRDRDRERKREADRQTERRTRF